MNISNPWATLGACLLAAMAQGCGGGGDTAGGGSVRFINATTTHSSLDLLANSSAVIPTTAQDAPSAYVSLTAASTSFQANDAGSSTSLALATSTVLDGYHYSVLAYESNGIVKAAVLGEDNATPSSGTAQLRIFDTATDAGALDIYVTEPAVELSSVSPTYTLSATTYAQSSSAVIFVPGTYRVRVTGADNKADLRLDMATITLTNQQVAIVVLTPTAGAALVNGALLVQQGAYTAFRNHNARVRLAAALSGGAVVTASAGTIAIAGASVSPSVGSYAVVPIENAPLAVSVNGTALAAPAITFAAGSDVTLLVHGSAAAATVTAITDDNHLPSSTAKVKLRLVNGLTGNTAGLSLNADFSVVANNVLPAQASAMALLAGNTDMRLEVSSPLSATPLYLQTDLNLPGNGVYSLFMLGDSATPVGLLRKDR